MSFPLFSVGRDSQSAPEQRLLRQNPPNEQPKPPEQEAQKPAIVTDIHRTLWNTDKPLEIAKLADSMHQERETNATGRTLANLNRVAFQEQALLHAMEANGHILSQNSINDSVRARNESIHHPAGIHVSYINGEVKISPFKPQDPKLLDNMRFALNRDLQKVQETLAQNPNVSVKNILLGQERDLLMRLRRLDQQTAPQSPAPAGQPQQAGAPMQEVTMMQSGIGERMISPEGQRARIEGMIDRYQKATNPDDKLMIESEMRMRGVDIDATNFNKNSITMLPENMQWIGRLIGAIQYIFCRLRIIKDGKDTSGMQAGAEAPKPVDAKLNGEELKKEISRTEVEIVASKKSEAKMAQDIERLKNDINDPNKDETKAENEISLATAKEQIKKMQATRIEQQNRLKDLQAKAELEEKNAAKGQEKDPLSPEVVKAKLMARFKTEIDAEIAKLERYMASIPLDPKFSREVQLEAKSKFMSDEKKLKNIYLQELGASLTVESSSENKTVRIRLNPDAIYGKMVQRLAPSHLLDDRDRERMRDIRTALLSQFVPEADGTMATKWMTVAEVDQAFSEGAGLTGKQPVSVDRKNEEKREEKKDVREKTTPSTWEVLGPERSYRIDIGLLCVKLEHGDISGGGFARILKRLNTEFSQLPDAQKNHLLQLRFPEGTLKEGIVVHDKINKEDYRLFYDVTKKEIGFSRNNP